MDVWLSVKEVRNLENISERAVRKRIQNGTYTKARQSKSCVGGGQCGLEWQVHVSSLSPGAQLVHSKTLGERNSSLEGGGNGSKNEEQNPASIEFAAASPSDQLVALARAELVDALYKKVQVLTVRSDRARTRALDRALAAFNEGAWRPLVDNGKPHDIRALLGRVSRGTYYRWRQALARGGLDGLLPAHGRRGRRIPEDMREEIHRMIWERPRASSRVYDFLKVSFAGRPDLPSYDTVHRYAADYKREHKEALTLAHKGESAWRHIYQPSLGSASAHAAQPNDVWEIDTTPADIMCKDNRRHKIIGLIDVFSRRAVFRLLPTSNGWGIAQTLRAGILAWGIPKMLLKDNGRDYQSRLVNTILDELGVAYPKLPFRTPEKKPHIERIFRTLSEGLFSELTGYTGNNLLNRPETIRLEYDPPDLQKIIDAWTANVYEEDVHRGLGRRPREAFQAPGFQPRMMASERQLDLLLMPGRDLKVRQGAIRRQVDGQQLIHFHEDLLEYNGERVDVKLDMLDAGRVHVFHRGRFVCEAVDVAASGVPLPEILAAGKRHKKAVKARVKAEMDLSRAGPIDGRIKQLLTYKEAERPAAFPQRAEVVRFEKYETLTDDRGPMIEENEQPPEDHREKVQIIALPNRPPDPENEPVFWEGEDPFFLDDFRKWIWVHVERLWKGEPVSEATRRWMEEYRASDDYRRMFVEHDFLQVYRHLAPKKAK